MLQDWAIFFGHFHPLVVHLPIGLLLFAFVLELMQSRAGGEGYRLVIRWAVLGGCISAVLACVLGWFLSLTGEYESDNFSKHQYTGIATALSALIWWYILHRHQAELAGKRLKWIPPVSCLALLTYAGHQGGTLTHGEDYLMAHFPLNPNRTSGSNDAAAVPLHTLAPEQIKVYAHLVLPVLEQKCWSCHNASKSKGGLRMHTEALLMKGGKHGAVVEAGNGDKSELVVRMLLPADDEKRMPPKGKPAPTEDEINLIRWWIQSGAHFDKSLANYEVPGNLTTYISGRVGSQVNKEPNAKGADSLQVPEASYVDKIPDTTISSVPDSVLALLAQKNVIVYPVARNSPFLELSAINAPDFGKDELTILQPYAGNFVSMQLDNTKISDAEIPLLLQFKHLHTLNLARTAITNKALPQLASLPRIYYLNVSNTGVSADADKLVKHSPTLKKFYNWNIK